MLIALVYLLSLSYLLLGLVLGLRLGFALFILGVMLFLWAVFRTGRKAVRESRNLRLWLVDNIQEIHDGQARYRGQLIKPETELVDFSLSMSFIIISTHEHSGYLIQDDFAKKTQVLFTIASLLFGWWALPFGPINSTVAIGNNPFPVKKTVSCLVEELLAEAKREEEKAERFKRRQNWFLSLIGLNRELPSI